ncbi:MAG: cysteine desulfurase NifS [Verrucomicrobia bacterium]|jgi:cysteine desulfurase|nr:cysteine desulfurase NifS [Verrucomicrobiota bacterium]MBT4276875.1 cysteine desulfurase NifS [Verrucomicrobiota bacterium]MBT5063275.1 cysteine desulfurase NifS [Verrucomicrobiota bacterium]MBT5478826.1 cysteine desulfurase NifS [Verrucomicrobiota bacterium]MBT6237285.1 cysteine desulfurase NifS [Verrucomicrobiota bacterium]
MYYLDNNGTTQVAPEVLEAMLPFYTQHWGNPSSAHRSCRPVKEALHQARISIASLINAQPEEIVFTGCGTESNNTAMHSALCRDPGKKHLITTAVEHSANLKYGQFLQSHGYDVTFLPVEEDGSIDICMLQDLIRPDTAMVSIMWANNETGVLFPIEEVAAICRSKEVAFHTDAIQAAGKVALDVQSAEVDYLSLSAHKIYAPKGIGALYVKKGTPYSSYLFGGGQESGRRAGTENVAGIVGFGRAAQMAFEDTARSQQTETLRNRMEKGILSNIPQTSRNGCKSQRLPNTSNIAFDGVEGEALLLRLDRLGVCASSGSACTTGSLKPSHVLLAMGVPARRALSSLRFSLGHYSSEEDVDYLLKHLPEIVSELRGQSPKPQSLEVAT